MNNVVLTLNRPILAVYRGYIYRWQYPGWRKMITANVPDAVYTVASEKKATPHTAIIYHGKNPADFNPVDEGRPPLSREYCNCCGIELYESNSYATPATALDTCYYCADCGYRLEMDGVDMEWTKV